MIDHNWLRRTMLRQGYLTQRTHQKQKTNYPSRRSGFNILSSNIGTCTISITAFCIRMVYKSMYSKRFDTTRIDCNLGQPHNHYWCSVRPPFLPYFQSPQLPLKLGLTSIIAARSPPYFPFHSLIIMSVSTSTSFCDLNTNLVIHKLQLEVSKMMERPIVLCLSP